MFLPPILLLCAMPPATAEVARSNWLGNYTQSWGAEKTVVIAGSSDNTVLAFNRVQPWSPATGVVNGSAIRMTFGGQELRGRLHPSGFIVWENDSRWTKEDSAAFKMMATSALKAAMASKAKPPSATAKGGPPADDESYESYSCASLPRQSLVCRLPTLTAFFAWQTKEMRHHTRTPSRTRRVTAPTRTLTNHMSLVRAALAPVSRMRERHARRASLGASSCADEEDGETKKAPKPSKPVAKPLSKTAKPGAKPTSSITKPKLPGAKSHRMRR